jgi:hypothetical protein
MTSELFLAAARADITPPAGAISTNTRDRGQLGCRAQNCLVGRVVDRVDPCRLRVVDQAQEHDEAGIDGWPPTSSAPSHNTEQETNTPDSFSRVRSAGETTAAIARQVLAMVTAKPIRSQNSTRASPLAHSPPACRPIASIGADRNPAWISWLTALVAAWIVFTHIIGIVRATRKAWPSKHRVGRHRPVV